MTHRDLPLISPSVLALGGLAGLLFALLAACGAGGPSGPACRTGTATAAPTPISESGLTLNVGLYEGTGSPQCIRGIGFQPILVIIKGDAGEWAVWRSGSMQGDSTADFSDGQPNMEDGITSLDPDAFSLGKAAAVNTEGVTYYYAAFADSPSIKVGSYVGDGKEVRSITGVGFQPALVFLKWDGFRTAVWRSATHADGVSSFFHGEGDLIEFIMAFEPDGFQVSADPWVNRDGGPNDPAVYHYVAFREAPGLLQTGTYIGDGSDSKDITDVGFQPDYVWVKRSSADSKGVHRSSSLSGDATLRFERVANGADEIKALLPDGFRVGSEPSVNTEGDTFNYVAWKSSSEP